MVDELVMNEADDLTMNVSEKLGFFSSADQKNVREARDYKIRKEQWNKRRLFRRKGLRECRGYC